MGLLEDLADTLSADVFQAMKATGDDRLYERVARSIGALSPSMEEAFLTSIRLRLAEQRGRQFLIQELTRMQSENS
ncbi:hypothetical protein [Falsigemmobacter faecalis]|uniref:Uncharacterized protein n=1 Tax=Falsigemmobacter faecalis TaxID=2488730 RepID=A0A3P3DI67_9RHOB|nr:hypothetical protein [Falsigemmobacter faecalis]RRH73524.1 hypothetical protein EG244_12655 [Falsigemmobacter faecalis]